VLGALVVVLALLAVGHALVTGVRRRRRELAVLKTLGFTRRQLFSTVTWTASTIAVLGGLIGIPLGLVFGRAAWSVVAGNLGVATDPLIGVIALIAVVPAAIVIANVIAALPARGAARTRPAIALRAE
jgi:ABC-type antimicrobial peptide transport system permease subunit